MNKFRSNRGGGSHRPTMHRTTCAECGNSCEVPFRPTGEKPVYCSDCFGDKGGGNSRNSNWDRGDNRGRGDHRGRRDNRGRGGDNRFDRRDSGRPSMHRAVCAECGNDCEVPFKPRHDQPVFCSECFGNKGGGNKGDNHRKRNNQDQYLDKFNMLNYKLDKILSILDPSSSKKDSSSEKEKTAVKKEKTAEKKKKVAKKAAVKEKTAKKTAAKKTAKAKKTAAKKPIKKPTKKKAAKKK